MSITENSRGIYLDGYVGEEDDGFTSGQLNDALDGKGDITIYINSYGGLAFEGAAMHSIIARHEGVVTCVVQGVALSAASLAIMAADEVVMADGAILMIHDPMNITMGNAEEHRETAGRLDLFANEFARIYSGRTGIPLKKIREMMKKETWMSPSDAIEMGFADKIEADMAEEPVAFDYTAFARPPEHLARMARERGWNRMGRKPAAEAAHTLEAKMPEKNEGQARPNRANTTAEGATMQGNVQHQGNHEEAGQHGNSVTAGTGTTMAGNAPTSRPSGTSATPEMLAVVASDARRRAVMSISRIDELTAAEVEQVVSSTDDPADAKMKATDMICDKRAASIEHGTPPVPNRSVTGGVSVQRDEGDTQMEGVIQALGNTVYGNHRYPLQDTPGMRYRGMGVYALAEMCAGQSARGRNRAEIAKAGMSARGSLSLGGTTMMGQHSTSDFAFITSELMNREMRRQYQSVMPTYQAISALRPASDFRTLHSVQFGGDFRMLPTNEAGEYESTTLTDEGESYAVKRYGREVALTFELVVNDDLGALSRLPMDFVRVARQKEEFIVWGLILSNGNLSDGVPIFDAARNNLAASGAAISVTTVGKGVESMMQQRPPGAKADGEDFIMATPNLLIVPNTLTTKARQFAAPTMPDTDANTNPYKTDFSVIGTPYISAGVTGGSNTAWYLADSSLPAVEHSFLSGYESPNVEVEEKNNPKGVVYCAEMMFGAGVVEPRGMYKNPGA